MGEKPNYPASDKSSDRTRRLEASSLINWPTSPAPRTSHPKGWMQPAILSRYLQGFVSVVLATLAGSFVNVLLHLNPANLVMFYLLAVVIVALRLGYGPAVFTAGMGVIAFNFFFVPPQLTFHVAEAQYLLTFLGLFIVGVVIANLTARERQQTEAAQRRERETAQLYSLSRELSASVDPQVIIRTVVEHAAQTFHCEAILYLPHDHTLLRRAESRNFPQSKSEQDAVAWAFHHAKPAGKGTPALNTSQAHYIPLRTAYRTIGVLGLTIEEPIAVEQQRLMDAFATQAALAIEATQLGEEARQAQLLREKEKLQSALLNSISHDLRTPLVSITGALSSLREDDTLYDLTSRRELLDGAYLEADRLNRLVGNLLDMSRLDSGSLKLKREPYDVREIIGVARSQLRPRLEGREIRIDLPDDLPMVSVDLVLFAQVIVNLLDNALKYSKPDKPIHIRARHSQNEVELDIADEGIGIPADELPHIFEKFYRARIAKGQGGSGLGLSICQGIVEAHGGTIRVQSREGQGTCFTIHLPINSNRQTS